MSEIVATLHGDQVVVASSLLTSDVDHTIEEVRQESQLQQNGGLSCGIFQGSARSSNRTLFCRKCEGHGHQVVLKGHASTCPYNNCHCKTCSNVMNMRANAIIRRYRTRTLEGGIVLKPVHFKNGNTRLRVFPKYVDESDAIHVQDNLKGISHEIILDPINVNAFSTYRQNTPPQTAVPNGANCQPPFPVKRSISDPDLDLKTSPSPPKQLSPPASDIVNVPTTSINGVDTIGTYGLLDYLMKNGGLNQDLLNTVNQILSTPITTTSPSFDASLLNVFSSIPNSSSSVTYTSPPTYTTSFASENGTIGMLTASNGTSIDQNEFLERKVSDTNLVVPTVAQLSELNIGVTSSSTPNSVGLDMAPKLTPNMFETACTVSNGHNGDQSPPSIANDQPEPFTSNLLISPTADRSHPLFKCFLNTVREIEKQMLGSSDS